MKRKTRSLIVTALVGLVAIGSIVFQNVNTEGSQHPPQTPVPSAAPPSTSMPTPKTDSDTASVEDPEAIPDYDRAKFGQRWADVDRNGCDTRNDVLRRDLTDATFKPGTRGCVVLTGTLRDPYSGETVRFTRGEGTSDLVPIDHIIALSPGWYWGAWNWTDELRKEFANDPLNLVATTRDSNGSSGKHDKPPSEWLPSDPSGRCRFAGNFLTLAEKYSLSIPEKEINTAQAALEECPSYTQQ